MPKSLRRSYKDDEWGGLMLEGSKGNYAPLCVADWPLTFARLSPASLSQVDVHDFLGSRIKTNVSSLLAGLDSAIPVGFRARASGQGIGKACQRLAADSDLYKWMEGAAYAAYHAKNDDLASALKRIARQILTVQHEDGYINTLVPPLERLDQRVSHDLYIAGHFVEAAVAYARTTGNTEMLKAASRWVDWLIEQHDSGHPYFSRVGTHEHPEIELALVRLYRATGDDRYLEFSKALVRMHTISDRVSALRCGGGERHAVRTLYLLTACAELYLETGEQEFLQHLLPLWDELVYARLYVTGGLGYNERIPETPYDLPQTLASQRDVAETCASVAMMMFGWRMHAITGESRYFDVIESILYNHFLGALSMDQLAIFYYNPLRAIAETKDIWDHGGRLSQRVRLPEIHTTACCFPNAWRFIAALPEYLFSVGTRDIHVNLYSSSTLSHCIDGNAVHLDVTTSYPHDGAIRLRIRCESPVTMSVHLRIPAWAKEGTIWMPGGTTRKAEPGSYAQIERTWHDGDTIGLELPMPVRMLTSHPAIAANLGQVAFSRGPIIYCLEQDGVEVPIEHLRTTVNPDDVANLVTEWRSDLLGGVNVIQLPLTVWPPPTNTHSLYFEDETHDIEEIVAKLIPFYGRANRSTTNCWLTFFPRGGGG